MLNLIWIHCYMARWRHWILFSGRIENAEKTKWRNRYRKLKRKSKSRKSRTKGRKIEEKWKKMKNNRNKMKKYGEQMKTKEENEGKCGTLESKWWTRRENEKFERKWKKSKVKMELWLKRWKGEGNARGIKIVEVTIASHAGFFASTVSCNHPQFGIRGPMAAVTGWNSLPPPSTTDYS